MGKGMTKSAILKTLAEKTELPKKQVACVLENLACLACKEAKNGFTVPGLGKLVLMTRAPRTMVMRFGPKAGQTINVPAKKVLKFRVAKVAKEAVLKGK
jgi:DNA-binding protein HU-beta